MNVGVDIVQISRIERLSLTRPKTLEKLLNVEEIGIDASSMAAKIAAKEAIIKAIPGLSSRDFLGITIMKDPQGRPCALLADASLSKMTIDLSMSHDGDFAIAVCVAVTS